MIMNNINQLRFLYPLMLLTCLGFSWGLIGPAHAQSASTTTPKPPEPAVTNTDSPIAQKGTSLLDNSLLWGSMVLHGIELLGLVTFMILLKEVKQTSQARDHKLGEKIATLENSLREQKTQLSNLDAGVSSLNQSTARPSETAQNFSPPTVGGNLVTPSAFSPSTRLEQTPGATIANQEYPFMELYQQSTDAFKHQYSPMAVSEDSENLQRRWAGEQQEIILGEDRQGNYWLVQAADITYLVPSPKLKVNDMNMRTAGGLFECSNYIPGYRTMQVVKPAIVSAQAGMGNQRWKLEQKGVLEFT
jgi:hypothetical protein